MLYKPSRLNQDNGHASQRTLSALRTVECAELVALDVFQHAEQTGQLVTLGQVERRLAELWHYPGIMPAVGDLVRRRRAWMVRLPPPTP